MATDNFAAEFKAAILAKPKRTKRDEKILAVLNAPPSKKRDKRIARMENHARAVAGIDPTTGAIDWGNFNWDKFLEAILSLLMKLLPLILI